MRTAWAVAMPNASRLREERQVHGQQQSPAQVAQRPALGGDRVALIRIGDFGQERIVEDDRRPEAQVGNQKEQPAQQIVVALHKVEAHGGKGPDIGEEAEHLLFDVRVVGDGPEDGQEEDLKQDGQGDHVGKEGVRQDRDAQRVDIAVYIGRALGHRRQKRSQKDGDHSRRKGRVGPIVEVPADLFTAAVFSAALFGLRRSRHNGFDVGH